MKQTTKTQKMEYVLQGWVLDQLQADKVLFHETANLLGISDRTLQDRFYHPKTQDRLTQAKVLAHLSERLNVGQDKLLVTNKQVA